MDNVVSLKPTLNGIGGNIALLGSKSITNRALIMASLADGVTNLSNASQSDDTIILIKALKELGVNIQVSNEKITVYGCAGEFAKKAKINIGAAGTAARFLTALLASIDGGDFELSGDKRMSERPIYPLVEALNFMGAEISYLGREGCLPLRIIGHKFTQKWVEIDGSISSQYITALLLLAPLIQGLQVDIKGELVSRSYLDMTIAGMKDFGVEVMNNNYQSFFVPANQVYQSQDYFIEGDASGASYFWGIAALSAGEIKVYNVNIMSSQGDARFPELLGEMGCGVTHGFDGKRSWIAVQGRDKLYPIQADMQLMPDTAQTLAVLAATCDGTSKICGISTLRNKETDRIQALIEQLKILGVRAEYKDDSLYVYGGTISPNRITTYNDHRMAMSFAMLGARYAGMQIEHPEVVNKSFPSFWQDLQSVGVKLE